LVCKFLIFLEKFKLKTSPITSPIVGDRTISYRSLNLECKQSSNDEESSEESKDGTIKFSRFSSKIKMERAKSQEIEATAKNLVYNIINKALEEIEKLEQKSSDEDDEEEDEYMKQIEQRMLKQNGTNNKITSIVNNTISNSRLANKFIETFKIKIYLLNTQYYFYIPAGINETIKDLKVKILSQIIKEGKLKIKYKFIEAYEIRLVDDEDDDILPNMEYPALDDKLNILKSKAVTLAFVEKINYNPETDMSVLTSNILGSTVKDSETVEILFKMFI